MKPYLVWLCASLIFLITIFHFNGEIKDFEDAATMGAATTDVFPVYLEKKIHCNPAKNFNQCIESIENSKLNKYLWIGNSQLHAVNQWSDGDKNVVGYLYPELLKRGIDLVTLSRANINIMEMYVLFAKVTSLIKIEKFFMPIFFDDMREDEISPDIYKLVDDKVLISLNQSEIGKMIVKKSSKGSDGGYQKNIENSIDTFLSDKFSIWESRANMRGLLIEKLYRLRNTIFNIKATSKRRKIENRYQDNLDALYAIEKLAKKSNVQLILYIPPLRSDYEMPYIETEYLSFIKDIERFCDDKKIQCHSLEGAVSNELWGTKPSTNIGGADEVDFMHFQSKGHEKFSMAIKKMLVPE